MIGSGRWYYGPAGNTADRHPCDSAAMPITINSPYSGRPVKLRDQDVGRAVRDEEGRVFYVVQRASGEGYYAALTRKGSPKDEERYDSLATKMAHSQEQVKKEVAVVHDATGKRRPSMLRKLVGVAVLLIVLAAIWYVLSERGMLPEGFPDPFNNVELPTPDPTMIPAPNDMPVTDPVP